MDPTRFDALARRLVSPETRRGLLTILTGGGIGALAVTDAAAGKSGACKPACAACQTCKKGKCKKKTVASAARRANVSQPGTERPAPPEEDSVRTRCASARAARRTAMTPASMPPSMRTTAAAVAPDASSTPFAQPESAAATLAPVRLPVRHAARRPPSLPVSALSPAIPPSSTRRRAVECRLARRVRPPA